MRAIIGLVIFLLIVWAVAPDAVSGVRQAVARWQTFTERLP